MVGAQGEQGFEKGFAAAVAAWTAACAQAGVTCAVVGLKPVAAEQPGDRDRVRAWLEKLELVSSVPAWVVYIGHGTYDGRQARLNLRGPDITAEELSEWLAPLKRPVVVIHGGSASAPFLAALSAPNRVVITATASGDEVNYARFGERFAENIGNRAADIDQDGQTSLLEAFLSAAQQVRTFYTEAGRMASEHPLLDDNGDKLGVSPDWFRGTRVVKRPENSQPVDGFRARQIVLMDTAAEKALTPGQRLLRDQYEQEMEHLRAKKAALAEDEYYRQLEVILRQLAAIYVPAKKS